MNVGSIDLRGLPADARARSGIPPTLDGLARNLAQAGCSFALLRAEDISSGSLNSFDVLIVLGSGAGRDLREAGVAARLVLWPEEADTASDASQPTDDSAWDAV